MLNFTRRDQETLVPGRSMSVRYLSLLLLPNRRLKKVFIIIRKLGYFFNFGLNKKVRLGFGYSL